MCRSHLRDSSTYQWDHSLVKETPEEEAMEGGERSFPELRLNTAVNKEKHDSKSPDIIQP